MENKENKTDGGPAFARAGCQYPGGDAQMGMSLREYYAGAALQGILANNYSTGLAPFSVAEDAVLHADRLIEELNKEPGTVLPDVEKYLKKLGEIK